MIRFGLSPEKRRFLPLLAIPLLVFLIIGALPHGVGAQSYDFTLETVSPAKTAAPGDLVTIVFSIENTGTSQDTYNLDLSLPEGWTAIGGLAPITVSPGGEKTVFITVLISGTIKSGDYDLTLTATSQNDTQLEKTADTKVTIIEQVGVKVEPPAEGKGAKPGGKVSYTFTVTNQGNVVDEFNLEVESSLDWPLEISREEIELLPGETGEVQVSANVPERAEAGVRDFLTLTADSTANREISGRGSISTRVLPPEPEAVGRTLYPEASADLGINIGLDGEGDNTKSLSLGASGTYKPGVDYEFSTSVTDDLELGTTNLGVSLENAYFDLGSVGVSSSLLSLSGTGLGAEMDKDISDQLTFFLDGATTEEGDAVGAALDFDILEIEGIVINEEEEDTEDITTQASSFSATLGSSNLNLSGDYGAGTSQGESGSAYRIRLFSSSEDIAAQGSLFRGDRDFPGSLANTEGISVAARVAAEPISASFSYDRSHDNVEEVQTRSTVTQSSTRIGVNASLEDLPDVSGSVATSRTESSDSSETDERSTSFSASASQTLGNFSYQLNYGGTRSRDYVADTKYYDEQVAGNFEINLEESTLSLGVSLSQVENLNTNTVEETGHSVSFVYSTTIGNRSADFSVSRSGDTLSFGVALGNQGGPGFDSSFGFNFDISEDGFSASINFQTGFFTPVKFKETKSQVEGRIFYDENGNGKHDPGESGVSDIVLTIEDSQALTGDDGRFRFPPAWPGNYQLGVQNLPSGLEFTKELPEVTVKAGERANVSLPVEPFSVVSGTVFNDKNKNGKREAGELGIGGIRLRLVDGVTKETTTNQNGRYSFQVESGSYMLNVEEASLPDRFEFTTKLPQSINLEERGRARINIGGYQKPRPILFSPTAEFVINPKSPAPGQEITLDASSSYDPDGSIVSYSWDLGNGKKASGKTVVTSYAEPGTYSVTLTITDNDGQAGSISKEITVKD